MEEERDWCVTKIKDRDVFFYAQHKTYTTFEEEVVAENLTREEALAMLATIGEVKSWSEDEFYAPLEE